MKKLLSILLALTLLVALFASCGTTANTNSGDAAKTIKVGASITPHAEILAVAKDVLAEKNITLEIVEFDDYVIPNTATESGELMANYFQHQPYLTDFNSKNNTHLVSVAAIHYEPFGVYGGKIKSLEELKEGSVIAVPNDGSNEARALMLLEANGVIKLKEGAGFTATVQDIVENPKNVEIKEIEAALLPRTLADVDLAVINGNYAIQAGLKVSEDAIVIEDKDSEASKTYANIVVVKEGNENNELVLALVEALKSEKVKTFIETKYEGSVIPMF
jgi:D-methionine transport system substrate-binding protein